MSTADKPLPQWATCPVAVSAGLWFRYGKAKRPEVASDSTFDAVVVGERTSTTRFLRWPGRNEWAKVRPGDLVRMWSGENATGAALVVCVDNVANIDLAHCTDEELEAWSRCEGWSPEKGRQLGRQYGPALWFRHTLIWTGSPPPIRKPQQMSLGLGGEDEPPAPPPPMPTTKIGAVVRIKHITRAMLQADRDSLWVFGDNMDGRGLKGQAAEMRGEPNAIQAASAVAISSGKLAEEQATTVSELAAVRRAYRGDGQ